MFGLVERPKDGMIFLPGRAAKDAGIDGFTHLGREDPGAPQCRVGAGTDAISGEDHQLPARGDESRQRPARGIGYLGDIAQNHHAKAAEIRQRAREVRSGLTPVDADGLERCGRLGRLGLSGGCLARGVHDAGHSQPQGCLQIISFMRVD